MNNDVTNFFVILPPDIIENLLKNSGLYHSTVTITYTQALIKSHFKGDGVCFVGYRILPRFSYIAYFIGEELRLKFQMKYL